MKYVFFLVLHLIKVLRNLLIIMLGRHVIARRICVLPVIFAVVTRLPKPEVLNLGVW